MIGLKMLVMQELCHVSIRGDIGDLGVKGGIQEVWEGICIYYYTFPYLLYYLPDSILF
jgi:hypothetical protein